MVANEKTNPTSGENIAQRRNQFFTEWSKKPTDPLSLVYALQTKVQVLFLACGNAEAIHHMGELSSFCEILHKDLCSLPELIMAKVVEE